MGRVRWSRPPECLNSIFQLKTRFLIEQNSILWLAIFNWTESQYYLSISGTLLKSAFMTQLFRFPAGNMLNFSWKETKSGENVWERTTSETWKLVSRCLLSGFQKPPSDRAAFAGIQSSRLHQTKWGRIKYLGRALKGTLPLKIIISLFQTNTFGLKWLGVNFHVFWGVK